MKFDDIDVDEVDDVNNDQIKVVNPTVLVLSGGNGGDDNGDYEKPPDVLFLAFPN